MTRSILVVDDHAGFRVEAREMFEAEGYDVMGEAVDCAQAIDSAARFQPDLIVVDVGLPDCSGIDLVARLTRVAPTSRIILVSARPERDFGTRIIESGATGFVEKAQLRPGVIETFLATES